jgi:hypothetical protein
VCDRDGVEGGVPIGEGVEAGVVADWFDAHLKKQEKQATPGSVPSPPQSGGEGKTQANPAKRI